MWSFSKPLFQICQKLGKEADGIKVFAMADSNNRKALGTAREPEKKFKSLEKRFELTLLSIVSGAMLF